jgi:hypothetical protein
VAGDSNGFRDIFLRDRTLGTTERVSVGTGAVQGESPGDAGVEDYWPAISTDGR